jgi:hypothetical protein
VFLAAHTVLARTEPFQTDWQNSQAGEQLASSKEIIIQTRLSMELDALT